MMYSQNDEEKHILQHFGDTKGRFLDIGAFDGVTFSNVRALYDRGWGGTLVEPSPVCFMKLIEHYDTSRVHLVNVALSAAAGLKKLHYSPDAVSTLDEKHRAMWAKRVKYTPIIINTTTVQQLINVCPGPYRFINLDVEGTNWEVLQCLPIDQLGCELLCVEFGAHGQQVSQWFRDRSWKLVARNGENQIWRR